MTKTFDPSALEDMVKRLVSSLPAGFSTMRDDLERNFRSILQTGLSRLDLVTRREFDVQAGVLQRTREKLEQLEARLAALEGSSGRSTVDAR